MLSTTGVSREDLETPALSHLSHLPFDHRNKLSPNAGEYLQPWLCLQGGA
jgi:hypothetical protein